jgi:hypothetical protein
LHNEEQRNNAINMTSLYQTFSVDRLPVAPTMAELFRAAGQQPDMLCGPYWIALLMQAYEVGTFSVGEVALKSGTVLVKGDPKDWLPLGADSKSDDALSLPYTEKQEEAGTSIPGLMAAVSELSQQQFCLVPLQADWSEDWVETLIHLCQSHPEWQAVPICNVQMAQLWSWFLGVGEAIAYLNGSDIDISGADWTSGHFLTIAGDVEGLERSLVIIRDSYPMFGWDGYHLQSKEGLAAALNRGDGYQGGVLLFVPSQYQAEVERQAQELGFTIAAWDNGTPYVKPAIATL